MAPTPAFAHDAFGDLGPFYSSFLHPAADPLQALLILGTAALLAARSLSVVRVALPAFILFATVSYVLLGWVMKLDDSPLISAAIAIAAGLAAALPDRWGHPSVVIPIIASTGVLVGLAPGAPPADGALFQMVSGTLLGIVVAVTVAWIALDAAARRVSWIAPAVAGSWVAAIAILVVASSV